MSAITSDELARNWARRLEDREMSRSGLPISGARKRVAARIGIAAGTLENLRRDRLKGVRTWIFERLQEALVHELQREQRAIEHELETLTRLGRDLGGREMEEARQSLEKVRQALDGRGTGV